MHIDFLLALSVYFFNQWCVKKRCVFEVAKVMLDIRFIQKLRYLLTFINECATIEA